MFTKSQVMSRLVIFIGENREDILNEVKKKTSYDKILH